MVVTAFNGYILNGYITAYVIPLILPLGLQSLKCLLYMAV